MKNHPLNSFTFSTNKYSFYDFSYFLQVSNFIIYSLVFACSLILVFTGVSNMRTNQQKRTKPLPRGAGTRSISIRSNKNLLATTNSVRTEGIVSVETTNETSYKPRLRQNLRIKVMRTQIGFLKVHKAASTTVQAIFLRFGWKRNLTFVLPPEFNYFRYPNIISLYDPLNERNMLPPPVNTSFDILCHHVLYDKEAWDKVLPLGYALIGSVRDPWELFKSMLRYMDPWYIETMKSQDKVATFLQDPLKFEPNDTQLSFTNNRMSIEFGVIPDIIKTRNFTGFQEFLQKIGQEFDLVIIAEQLDESLILLRRFLNWSLKDILYTSKNVRNMTYPAKDIPRKTDLDKFKTFCAFDYLLYDFFKQKLKNQILAEGHLFSSEVRCFQEIQEVVENFCKRFLKHIPFVVIAESEWNPEFLVDREDCDLLLKYEITFTQEIRKRQYGSATWKANSYANVTATNGTTDFQGPG